MSLFIPGLLNFFSTFTASFQNSAHTPTLVTGELSAAFTYVSKAATGSSRSGFSQHKAPQCSRSTISNSLVPPPQPWKHPPHRVPMAVCTGFKALAAGAHKWLAALSVSTFRQRMTKFCAIYIITQLLSEQQLIRWVKNNHVRKKRSRWHFTAASHLTFSYFH